MNRREFVSWLGVAALAPLLPLTWICQLRPRCIHAAQSGDWHDPATWAGGVVPGERDSVVIGSGKSIRVTRVAKCGIVSVEGPYAVPAALELQGPDCDFTCQGVQHVGAPSKTGYQVLTSPPRVTLGTR